MTSIVNMTPTAMPVPVEEWMEQLPIDSITKFCTCNDDALRRRYARLALFKPMALKEIQCRYNKYKGDMQPVEMDAYKETLEAFRGGSFTAIRFDYGVGTFYSPRSLLVWVLVVMIGRCNIFVATKMAVMGLYFILFKMNDNFCAWGYWLIVLLYLVALPMTIVGDILIFIVVVPLLLLVVPLIEVFLLVGGLLSGGVEKYRKLGFFRSSFTIHLVLVSHSGLKRFVGGNQFPWFSEEIEKEKVKIQNTVTHVPLHRVFHGGPLEKIFTDMDARFFGFGSVGGQQLTAEDIERYNFLLNV